ncbi:phasin family protein [Massilia sp. GCM10023247]|uniref:phasin family protein n=1 Tax=Massilia sp. GCM10023247 TaxID=3252643 RepID=UPI0036150D56
MTSLPEQFSAARQAQLDNSFKLIRSFSDQALDRTSRVLALQLHASRAAVEQSSQAMRQLLAARDPRDLLALGSQSQQHLSTMLDYSRELFSIATSGMSIPMLRSAGLPGQAAPEPAPQQAALPAMAPTAATQVAAEAFERIGGDTASATAAAAESAAESVVASDATDFALPGETPAEAGSVEVVTSDVEPDAAPTTIAKATSEALDAPVAPPHPVAASVPVEVAVEIELPKVEPVEATPPPAAGTTRPTETRGTKGRRKQN